ncbi:hypothetical protein UY3_03934 [Chelonia mydas]|uniref:Uncharacterized protein n=1 Tax=Chelonia mydas TaxID=8469 RepID=M7BNS4_CHEMY|nr:hypothetical protein UY3_03934 [Chelonia mydas]
MPHTAEAAGRDRKRKYKKLVQRLSGEGAAEEDRCFFCATGAGSQGEPLLPRGLAKFLETPAPPDAEELLPLPLAVYPAETEDDPWMQVHPRGRVGRSTGEPDYRLAVVPPETRSALGWPGVQFLTRTPGRKGILAAPVSTADRAIKSTVGGAALAPQSSQKQPACPHGP